jgi:hypothetical protein
MLNKMIIIVMLVSLMFSTSSCATIFHSERRGNSGGQLDVGMFVCDLLWLFAGFIPGVIAVAVDFGTGAIWLEKGSHSLVPQPNSAQAFNTAHAKRADLVRMPSSGTFNWRLPVRGEGGHVIDISILTDDGKTAASDTFTFHAIPEWKNISSSLSVDASGATNGKMLVRIDGFVRAEMPVEFAATPE